MLGSVTFIGCTNSASDGSGVVASESLGIHEIARDARWPSLDSRIGSRVTIEGEATMLKEGYAIETSGVHVLVDIPNSIADDWPFDDRRIQVTGTLEKGLWQEYPYSLLNARWTDSISNYLAGGTDVFVFIHVTQDSERVVSGRELDMPRLVAIAGREEFILVVRSYDDLDDFRSSYISRESGDAELPLVLHVLVHRKLEFPLSRVSGLKW